MIKTLISIVNNSNVKYYNIIIESIEKTAPPSDVCKFYIYLFIFFLNFFIKQFIMIYLNIDC